MNDLTAIAILVVLFLVALFVIPQLMVARAIPQVINTFRKQNAVGIENARTLEELGFKPRVLFDRMTSTRDYKPRALQLLIQTKVVQTTEDGKVYLSKENLAKTRWSNC